MAVAGWLTESLAIAAARLPSYVEWLLQLRRGSWQANHVRQLVNGTIGWHYEFATEFRDGPR